MIDVVVLLKIRDQSLFLEFETKALEILKSYEGKLVSAFEPSQNESSNNNVDEIHCLRFPSMDEFNAYRADAELAKLAHLRSEAIEETEIFVSATHKAYGSP
jgi:uncharacterized protein (DUF1330 family)